MLTIPVRMLRKLDPRYTWGNIERLKKRFSLLLRWNLKWTVSHLGSPNQDSILQPTIKSAAIFILLLGIPGFKDKWQHCEYCLKYESSYLSQVPQVKKTVILINIHISSFTSTNSQRSCQLHPSLEQPEVADWTWFNAQKVHFCKSNLSKVSIESQKTHFQIQFVKSQH